VKILVATNTEAKEARGTRRSRDAVGKRKLGLEFSDRTVAPVHEVNEQLRHEVFGVIDSTGGNEFLEEIRDPDQGILGVAITVLVDETLGNLGLDTTVVTDLTAS
jgi:hypothetical protein